MNEEPEQIANQIEQAVKTKGTIFLGFTYVKKDGSKSRRNLTVGAKIDAGFEKRGNPLKGQGVTWGSTEGTRSCIQKNGNRIYVRGFENRDDKAFKVFAIDSMSDITGI